MHDMQSPSRLACSNLCMLVTFDGRLPSNISCWGDCAMQMVHDRSSGEQF